MSVINSPSKESIRDAAIGGALYGTFVGYIQYRYSQGIDSILLAGITQFGATFLNGSVNLRIYNATKNKVFELTNNPKLSKGLGGLVSGLETFIVVGGAHLFNKTSGALYIASCLALISALATPTLYEKILQRRKNIP